MPPHTSQYRCFQRSPQAAAKKTAERSWIPLRGSFLRPTNSYGVMVKVLLTTRPITPPAAFFRVILT